MDYDLAIIGAGWAGFNAGIRAKELGLKVALIEKGEIGGTCLNRGCIPTKTLIQSAKIYSLAKKSANFGVQVQNPQINFTEIQARKEKIIRQLTSGIEFMLKGIEVIKGEAKIVSANKIEVNGREVPAKFILIATGSRPVELKGLKFDGKKILTSDDILNLKEVPRSLLIVGGGVIGCEFASLFANLGAEVTVAEKMPRLLPGEDSEVARKLEQVFKKKKIKVSVNTDATALDLNDYSLVLVCVGRAPAEKIIVDEYLRTQDPNVYAAGDCTGKIMLAHFAAYQGRIAAENIASGAPLKKADNTSIPNCIFTDPEIASVGLSEEGAKNKGLDISVRKFDFLGLGMARILDESEGFIKIISDNKTGQILGASIIGPRATELIGILTLAVQSRLKLRQVQETIFAHPTVSESITDALKGNRGI
ncbi:MAG: dihydrolipoyl dehydrogenase [Candidatus Omnitrophota bacterium]|jgi:dihydrolipoamide dehydrogenase